MFLESPRSHLPAGVSTITAVAPTYLRFVHVLVVVLGVNLRLAEVTLVLGKITLISYYFK